MRKVDVHADDYGLTLNTSKDIMEGINAGKLNSISIMPNTTCFEEAREYFYKKETVIPKSLFKILGFIC